MQSTYPIASFVVLAMLMLALQFSPSRKIGTLAPPNVCQECTSGWPFGFFMSVARKSSAGSIVFDDGYLHYRQAAIDVAIGGVAVLATWLWGTRVFIARIRSFSIASLLAFTAGVAVTVAYFLLDHDIYAWNCRVYAGSLDRPVRLLSSGRPLWQNAVVGFFVFSTTNAIAYWAISSAKSSPSREVAG